MPTYFILVFAISWGGFLLLVGGPGGIPRTDEQVVRLLPAIVLGSLLGPSLACLLVTGLVSGRAGYHELLARLVQWRVAARWYAVALLATPLLKTAVLFALLFASPVFVPAILLTNDKATLLIVGLGAGLAVGFFEELGWTGFAVPRLRARHDFVTTGLIVGLLWGAWHYPLFAGSAGSSGTVPPILYELVLLFSWLPPYRVLMVWVYDRTGSLLLAVLMHAGLVFATLALSPLSLAGEAVVTYNLAFAGSLWMLVGAVVMAEGGRLSRQPLSWRVVLPAVAVLWGVYLGVLYPWLVTWGATAEEQQLALPGDEAVPSAYFTRAITIDAPPSAVWPWIVQMGQDRAGFYSNTWLENLTGADIHNADTVHPEWQQRAIGDSIPLARPDLLFGLGAWGHTNIVLLEPQRAIGDIVGRFVLQPIGDHGTRLLFRESVAAQGPIVTRLLVWDPMHAVMVRRVLEGIKERAEGQPLVPGSVQRAARVGWLLAGVTVGGLFLSRRRSRPWLALPVLVVIPPFLASGDWDAALAGFLAVGITLGGVLAFGRRWWPAFLLIFAAVLLILLLAPDAYAAFGLVFVPAVALVLVDAALRLRISGPRARVGESGVHAWR